MSKDKAAKPTKAVKLPKLKIGVSFADIQEKATETIFDLLDKNLPREEVIEGTVDSLVKYVDDLIEYPGVVGKIIDTFDHIVAKAFIMLLVHEIYDDIHTTVSEGMELIDDGA